MKPRVKICGITSLGDALGSAEAGADALGFVFYRKSPRFIDPAEAGEIVRKLAGSITIVGVFVNETPEKVRDIVDCVGLGEVQLHGDEDPSYVEALKGMLSAGVRIVKAVRVSSGADITRAAKEFDLKYFLLDSHVEGFYGGSGESFDWTLLSAAEGEGRRYILAGGLTPGNVARAASDVHPYGVDVSSGVEKSPGKKDLEKVRKFIDTIRDGKPRDEATT